MKRIVALLLAALILAFSGAIAENLPGGWSVAEDNEVTEELNAIFGKAMMKLLGVSYLPVAYLGAQTVAGQNYCFLAKAAGTFLIFLAML